MTDGFEFAGVVNSLCAASIPEYHTVSSANMCATDGGALGGGFGGFAGQVVTSSALVGTCWPAYGWWPTYWPTVYEDRTAKAFRVVKALMDKKAVKCNSVKQFVDLVNAISEVL